MKEWNRASGRPKETEIGSIVDVMDFKTTVHRAKELNHQVKAKKNIDPMENVVEFKPNYSTIDALLQIIGQYYESSKCVGFRIVDIRREKEEGQDSVDEFNEWRNSANEKYKLMIKG